MSIDGIPVPPRNEVFKNVGCSQLLVMSVTALGAVVPMTWKGYPMTRKIGGALFFTSLGYSYSYLTSANDLMRKYKAEMEKSRSLSPPHNLDSYDAGGSLTPPHNLDSSDKN